MFVVPYPLLDSPNDFTHAVYKRRLLAVVDAMAREQGVDHVVGRYIELYENKPALYLSFDKSAVVAATEFQRIMNREIGPSPWDLWPHEYGVATFGAVLKDDLWTRVANPVLLDQLKLIPETDYTFTDTAVLFMRKSHQEAFGDIMRAYIIDNANTASANDGAASPDAENIITVLPQRPKRHSAQTGAPLQTAATVVSLFGNRKPPAPVS